MKKLARSFYDRDTIVVAKELLGKYLVHISEGVEVIGKIVEVEAYLGPHDLAAHSSKGLTERTIKRLLAERGHGLFASLDDFHRRVEPLPEESEAIIRAGGFDEFGHCFFIGAILEPEE